MASTGGIVNIGATCYANAVIQAFANCEKLVWLLQEGRYSTLFRASPKKTRELQQSLTTSFAEVLRMLHACKDGQSVRPIQFWKTLGQAVEDTCYSHLATRQPHDSHEFFMFILDTLHESLSQEVEMRVTRPPPKTEEDHLVILSLESWQKEFSKHYSPLIDMFFGLAHVTITCQGCGKHSHRWETFTTLKGVVSGNEPLSLQQMLEEEMKPETISEYVCDSCAPVRKDAKRTVRIWRLPQTLVIVLKRFSYTGQKINTPMTPLASSSFNFAPFFSAISPEKTAKTNYSLHSIVDHHGSSTGGHYTAQIYNSDTWQLHDDEAVYPISNGPKFGSSTYMLFFQRTA